MPSPAEWAREQALERGLRKFTGLQKGEGLHPSPKVFFHQAEALACLEKLVATKQYTETQLGLFAKEVGEGGKRQFIVHTYAGFALDNAPHADPQQAIYKAAGPSQGEEEERHLYEVIREGRPCWLYFDLEYSCETNPGLDAGAVMKAFRDTLADFCADAIGSPLDESSVIVLDSSTPRKFSKHVLVHRLRGAPGDPLGQRPLAFANNAQAGLFVSEMLAYAHARRSRPDSPARHLFMNAPASARDVPGEVREACLVDESVYSRNRSFRLLYQAKYGKSAALMLSKDGRSKYPVNPPFQFLGTMASFVPEDTPLFTHALIPRDFTHSAGKVQRVLPVSNGPRPAAVRDGKAVQPQQSGLLQHLIETWDSVRNMNEPRNARPASAKTTVQSIAEMSERTMTVTLDGNRFCFCKGASHKSNHVYMVVDRQLGTFHQKCFDIDCRNYCSPAFQIPAWLLEDDAEEAAALQTSTPPCQTAKRPRDADTPQLAEQPEKRPCAGFGGPMAPRPPPAVACVATPQAKDTRRAFSSPSSKESPAPASLRTPSQQHGGTQRSRGQESDDELIGADPDEVAIAEGCNASQESADWFDVDRLW